MSERSLRAFIVRPFGTKKDRNQNEVNFDAVQEQLIVPALESVGVDGRTTLDILRAGNIRVDMFQRLLTADLVVADLSIDNANVFYELGIRHALREKRTFMLRCEGDKYPFDLQTDRYFIYQREDPAASLKQLVAALRQTLNSEERDSPVFKLLPNLEAQDRSRFLAVPMDFREEVEQASAKRQAGDLELLGMEARGLEWESEGLRVVGRAQFRLNAFKGACATWEAVCKFDPKDREANTLLGTIYQRLGDLTRSDQALRRAFERKDVASYDRAEVHSLLGRNAKVQWKADWERLLPEQQRQRALRSGFLEDSFKAYAGAFGEDLNHYYSGLNALGLLTIEIELATALPDVWEERFDEPADALRELDALRKQAEKLSAAVGLSLQATLDRLKREGRSDVWVEISEADLCFLLRERLPERVLAESEELPRWLREKPNYSIWQRDNLWMLYNALAAGGDNVTLIALWNGEAGDGSGGTADLVDKAGDRGAKPIVLKTKDLFGV
jgi:hypothetical protein